MMEVLVLNCSAYGHIKAVAHAVANGACPTGAQVDVRRVPETLAAEVATRLRDDS